MKLVMGVTVEGLTEFELSAVLRCTRREFHFEDVSVLPGPGGYSMEFSGVLSLDEPTFEWCKALTQAIWKATGHFLTVRYNFHRLLDDARVYPRYVKYDFDDEGEHDDMKIAEALEGSQLIGLLRRREEK